MKSKAILVYLITFFALMTVIATVSMVSASDLSVDISTTVNGVDLGDGITPGIDLSENTGSTVPVRVELENTGTSIVEDARVKVYISGEDIEAETGKFDLLPGKTYSKLLSVKLPASIKTSPSKSYRLVVVVEANEGDQRKTYDFTVQRESYNTEILSVDVDRSVTAGSTLNVDVVIKNRGSHRLDDNFVVVRIPALDIEKKVYFSDLAPMDGHGSVVWQDNQTILVYEDSEKQDSASGTISVKIPSDAKAGVYDVEVEASNADSTTTTTKRISVLGLEQGSDVLVAGGAKDIASGTTVTYDLILVNSGNRIAVYDIVPENAQNLVVSVDEPIVTVAADSSRVVKVKATAGNVMGTFNFAVNVNSQGQLVKKVNLSANVVKGGITTSNNVIILTIVLAIIFIVLLVVLIVLLTRKPAKSEEFEESYY